MTHYCTNPEPFHTPQRPWGEPSVIATGYFDGETEGLLQCGLCDQTYRFSLLDWDENQDLRIFSLSRMQRTTFMEIVSLLERAFGERRTPYWVPHNPMLSDDTRREVLGSIAALLKDNEAVESVLLSEHIEREILSLVVLKRRNVAEAQDWWTILAPAVREQ